ncbi:actin-related protein 9 [Tanacetum coccineum]
MPLTTQKLNEKTDGDTVKGPVNSKWTTTKMISDYTKSVIPSHLFGDRNTNLVVINPGSANIRIGLAQQDVPFNIPHCIARRTTGANHPPRKNVQDQMLNSQVTTAQHVEREKAYDIIASLLKIPFIDEEAVNNSYPRKTGRVDALSQQNSKKDIVFPWTDVFQKSSSSSLPLGVHLFSYLSVCCTYVIDDGAGTTRDYHLGLPVKFKSSTYWYDGISKGPAISLAVASSGPYIFTNIIVPYGFKTKVIGPLDRPKFTCRQHNIDVLYSSSAHALELSCLMISWIYSSSHKHETNDSPNLQEGSSVEKPLTSESKYKEYICGEEAMRISPTEPYCLRRPIRRGHLNISLHYSMQQVLEDIQAIWDWILIEKLHIPHSERNMYSALIVVPETFDNREIKEILSIVLRDLRFSSAVVHQEGLAAAFGNGLPTACIVNMGAQDGVALPHTQITLCYGGDDVSRCLLWTQRHHQTWPPILTDALAKPIDLLMLNRLKESYCQIHVEKGVIVRVGQGVKMEGRSLKAVGVVHSYEDGLPPASHKTKLTALNVAPMGLFYPPLLVPDVYPPPPRTWFKDYEDMLEDNWNIDFARRTDVSDSLYPGISNPLQMWDNYPYMPPNQQKKEEKIGLAEAISKSILSAGRIDLQRKLFCSMQLIGGVGLTTGLVSAVEDRVLAAIPHTEAIDSVEVLQSRTNPLFVAWRGGAILGVLDYGREAWIHREDWIQNGIHIATGRKYKDSYYLQAQPMCYINF